MIQNFYNRTRYSSVLGTDLLDFRAAQIDRMWFNALRDGLYPGSRNRRWRKWTRKLMKAAKRACHEVTPFMHYAEAHKFAHTTLKPHTK